MSTTEKTETVPPMPMARTSDGERRHHRSATQHAQGVLHIPHDVVIGGELLPQPRRIADRTRRPSYDIGLILPAGLASTVQSRPAVADFRFPLAQPVLADARRNKRSDRSKKREGDPDGKRIAMSRGHALAPSLARRSKAACVTRRDGARGSIASRGLLEDFLSFAGQSVVAGAADAARTAPPLRPPTRRSPCPPVRAGEGLDRPSHWAGLWRP